MFEEVLNKIEIYFTKSLQSIIKNEFVTEINLKIKSLLVDNQIQ